MRRYSSRVAKSRFAGPNLRLLPCTLVKERINPPLTYRDAGVDIEGGERLVERIKSIAEKTHRSGVLGSLGGFAALFEVPVDRYRHPVLVSGTDGVGTKIKLAIHACTHAFIGIDLVAMCVNDVLVTGAEPLYFLDYFATGQLDVDVAHEVVRGIGRGCELGEVALVGGETAEMPGLYRPGDYDLAGFCVGVVERDGVIDGRAVTPGDVIIGIASSGPHANGFSLIRRIIDRNHADLGMTFDGRTLGEILLEPTRIYTRCVRAVTREIPVGAIAHITGGGLVENIPRVLPRNTLARLDVSAWTRPPIFDWLRSEGNVRDDEMYRTFNCGVGMVLSVSAADASQTIDIVRANGAQAWAIGVVEETRHRAPEVILE